MIIRKLTLTWASYAIWINIILSILLVLSCYLIFYLDIRRGVGFHIIRVFGFIANPVQSIFDTVLAPPSVQQTDGSVHVTYSFMRTLFADFFNLVFYSIVGVFAKVLKDNKITSQST